MHKPVKITQALLTKILAYNPKTGKFVRRSMGREVGTVNNCGFLVIRVNGRVYAAHRLAWLYCYGKWPRFQLKQLNRDKRDIRINNLIDGTGLATTRPVRALSGHKGVYWHEGRQKWEVKVCTRGAQVRAGRFTSKAAANRAYRQKAKEIREKNLAAAISRRALIRLDGSLTPRI